MYFIFVGTKPIQTIDGLVCFDTQDEAAEFMEAATALVSFAVPSGGGIRCVDDDAGPPIDINTIPTWVVGRFPWVERAMAVIAESDAADTARSIHEAQSRGAADTIAQGLARSLRSDALTDDERARSEAGVKAYDAVCDEIASKECAHEVDPHSTTPYLDDSAGLVDVVCRKCGVGGSFAVTEVEINW